MAEIKEVMSSENPLPPHSGPGFALTPTLQLTFSPSSPQNPNNWPLSRKLYIVLAAFLTVINTGISSSLPSNAVPFILTEFNLADNAQSSLPTATFLIGYIVGPLIFSPLSETIGRRLVIVPSFTVFVVATLACALAPTWPALLFFRFLCGTMGAAPQTVVGGIYADIFFDARLRGRAMVFYMSAASFGPILGPIISGFASEAYGWRWTFWIELIFAGVCWVGIIFLPETFGPVILKREAERIRQESGCEKVVSSASDEKTDLVKVFQRPLAMLFFEPIVTFTSIYISLAYSLVFFYFQAYPIIFGGVYNLSIQTTSLAFLPVGIGASTTGLAALYYDTIYERAKKASLAWTTSPELHRLPLSCAGGLALTTSLFWLAWTATPNIHWAVPVVSGLVFGFGYQTIFVSLMTYMTDAYGVYSASALASSVILRSVLGALLPLAAGPLYGDLGVSWGTSVLGFVSLVCVPIPFGLVYWGEWIRGRSRFCRGMKGESIGGEDGGGLGGGQE